MNDIDIRAIDLNLLVALDALLTTRSVTRAARQLGVGQPAASHALRRLRGLFCDPLLVRAGRSMAPTPRAEALRAPLSRLLADATRLVAAGDPANPGTSTRTFTIRAPDLLASVIPRVAARLAEEAPRATLVINHRQRDDTAALADGRADVLLGPSPDHGPGLVQQGLGRLRFCVLARAGHPGLTRARRLSRRSWRAYPHVMVNTGHGGESIVARELARQGVHRSVTLVVPSFLAALVAVSRTDAFFTIVREPARPLLKPLGLVALEPPIALPSVAVAAVWHERFHEDPLHRFFRALLLTELRAALESRRRS